MSILRKALCGAGRHSGAWSLPGSRCEISRICASCGKHEETTRHSWGPFRYGSDDRCEEIRRCERCGSTESRVSHEWGPWLYYDAEAVTAHVHTCRRCHLTERTSRFTAL